MNSLANIPNFLAYFAGSLILLGAFLVVYTWLTPIAEWKLIRAGNHAVALAMAGATFGFSLPLATSIMHTDTFADMVIWATISAVVQLVCFAGMRLLRRDAPAALANGDMAEAIVLATISVTLGMLNAACLT